MRTNNEIITLIQDRIDEKGMSMSELARRVGIAKSTMSRYFNRTREFPLNKTDDFAKVLGMTPEYLLGIQKVNNIEPEILTIFNQLDEDRQANVIDYATVLLNEQNNMKTPTVLEKYKDDDYIIDYVEDWLQQGMERFRKIIFTWKLDSELKMCQRAMTQSLKWQAIAWNHSSKITTYYLLRLPVKWMSTQSVSSKSMVRTSSRN